MPYIGEQREWVQTLGKNMAEARKAAGLTQEQLAIRVRSKTGIDIKQAQIQQYELGNADPPGSKLDAIAYALGVEVSALTGRRRVHPLEVAFADEDLTEQERQDALDAALAYIQVRRRRRSTNET